MVTLAWGNALLQLVMQSDIMTKFILVLLLSLSILCWGIFFYKWALVAVKERHIREIKKALKEVKTFHDLRELAARFAHTIPGYMLSKNIMFIKQVLDAKQEGTLAEEDREYIDDYIYQTVDELMQAETSYLTFLSTTAAVAPLLGLFGTVWGLVHAFVNISQQQTADIVTIAPGIAEALITTLAGLMVAIPVLAMYHFLHQKARLLEFYYLNLADTLRIFMKRFLAKG